MDLGVTVHTTLPQQELRRHVGREAIGSIGNARVAGLRVAALAKQRCTLSEHARMIRTMWRMTKPAILAHRSMFPQERAAFLGMTIYAGIVQCRTCHGGRNIVGVRAVTPGTGHLVLKNRVRERLHRVITLQLVAVTADLGLGRYLLDRIGCRVTVVTIRAQYFVTRVSAVVPAKADVAVMTFETHAVLRLERCIGAGREGEYRWSFLTSPYAPRVRVARSVASLALQLLVSERPARVGRNRVRGLEDRQRRRIVMARQAGVSTLACVFRFLAPHIGGGHNQEQDHRNTNCDGPHFCAPDPGLVEVKFTNAMHHFDIRRTTRAMT